jgi:outer membrane protein assembly factor BamD
VPTIRQLTFTVLAVAALVGPLSGCKAFRSSEKANTAGTPEALYERARGTMESGNIAGAIKIYEALEARYPFSDGARQGKLDLLYAYYRSHETETAIDAADSFIRENPTHPRIDYAYYIKGLVYFEHSPNFLEKWFDVDMNERPPQEARQSFQAFATVVNQFPTSAYAHDSRQRMIYLRNRLAEYEVGVARYYMRRGAYVAAINRAKYSIENYDGAPATRDALEILVKGYTQLKMPDVASQSASVLATNFPGRADQLQKDKKSWWKFW